MENKLQLSENHENKYQHYEHSVGTIMLHLEWCTKTGIKCLEKKKIKIIELNVQPEHVHCIVLVKFNLSVSKVLQLLKGISSKLFLNIKKKQDLYILKEIFGAKENLHRRWALLD